MKINQFHSGTAQGDAITNQMLEIKRILVNEGYESEIYAQHIAPTLIGEIKKISSYKGDKDAILIVHHSMGHDLFEKITSLPDKKILIYHNITPERFFEDEGIKKYIRIGLKQTKDYRKYIQYAIADSNYNRQELIAMGYKNVDVMPVQISLNRFEKIESDTDFAKKYQNSKNILFVGRVVPNKRQSDVIKAFAIYEKYFNENAKLLIVGDTGHQPYVEKLKNLCKNLQIEKNVDFLGKVSEEELKACYEVADVFLCMSEHEGFGVPLLEAMTCGVPVVALRSSAIPETMGGAGILVSGPNYPMIGSLLDEVIENKELYQKIVDKQYSRVKKLADTDTKKLLLKAIDNVLYQERKRTIQMQGPFETSYSLAIVNRKLIEAIDDMGIDDASIYCTEGPGDYEPKEADLRDKPHARRLWEKSIDVVYPDITIRNMYPPRVADANGGLNFLAFGWEESIIPPKYVRDFNKYLSGIGTMSDFVTKSLVESGVTVPVKTMGLGVELSPDFDALLPYKLKTKKTIKYLHISSAFPRKGVDILLDAYFEAFTDKDDVCLVIKTFPNPHNNVEEQLKILKEKYPHGPEVEVINKDLSQDKLYSLYKAVDCYVSVARGEGFGLPVAEAMLAKVPVIVSPNTGMADFCNESTAFLVGYKMEKANTHLTTEGAMWAKPNKAELVTCMRAFVFSETLTSEVEKKVKNAYELISNKFTWKQVAKNWMNFISEVEEFQSSPKVAMISTWNTKCGIAEFTKMQCDAMHNMARFQIYPNYGEKLIKTDEAYVNNRLWKSAFEGDMQNLKNAILKSDNEIIHIQFNFGFFRLEDLADFIESVYDKKRIIITFHKTKDANVGGKKVSLKKITNSLNKCDTLVVHQKEDKEVLLQFGVKEEKISLIPLGQLVYEDEDKKKIREKYGIKNSVVVGSYGFLLPQKGVLENIRAMTELRKKNPDILYLVVCALHDSDISRRYYEECKNLVKKNKLEENVRFVTDYLPNDKSIEYLHACDILLMTYLPSMESASGAIRFCVAAKRPIVTTKQAIFEEFAKCTYQIKENRVEYVVHAVNELLNEDNQTEYLNKIEKQIEDTSWEKTGERYLAIYK